MRPEGMVHALEEIGRLLRPGGCLIDIHPTRTATKIEVHQSGIVVFSGSVPGQSFQDIQSAEDAMARTVREGLFAMEREAEFDWRTYAPSISELRDYVAQESAYDDEPSKELLALQEGELAASVERVLRAAGRGAEVARLNRARIARLSRAGH